MTADDILRKLSFGVKKTKNAKKVNAHREKEERALRLRVVPEDVKNALNQISRLRRLNRMFAWGEKIPEPVLEWEDVDGMPVEIVASLQADSIQVPTPIQMQAIPIMLHRRNLLASAPTGSGKTLAFSIPIILDVLRTKKEGTSSAPPKKKKNKSDVEQKKKEESGISAIVLEPTRELAKQTYRALVKTCAGLAVSVGMLAEGDESAAIHDIVVSTPNRVVHCLFSLSLSSLRWLVVDESDRLFDAIEGDDRCFRNQLGAIYRACSSPLTRRAFFSATFSYEVEQWCKENLDDVAMLCIGERNSANTSVQQELIFAGSEQGKVVALRDLLSTQFTPPALVFVQSKERARQLMSALSFMATPVPAAFISSEKTPEERERTLESFRAGRVWVLVCTELLSRGLDLPAVNLVVNFDLPSSIVSYIHRIGRTGRAGRTGRSITYFTEDDMAMVRPIAVVISQAGGSVPEYTRTLKAPNKGDRKQAHKHAPKRNNIAMLKKRKFKDGPGKVESKAAEQLA